MQPKNALSRWTLRAVAVVLGIAAAALLLEFGLRVRSGNEVMASTVGLAWMRKNLDAAALYTVDPELGFVPLLGSPAYDEFGVRRNQYPREKRPGVERVLFIGDSATQRGVLPDALREIYGDWNREYWNAGVESFNALQVLRYFERVNASCAPDRVVFTLHNNDFEPTPVVFRDESGRLASYEHGTGVRRPISWLYEESRLYRTWFSLWRGAPAPQRDVARDVEAELVRLKARLDEQGIAFDVLVLPILMPLERWNPRERASRELALAMLERLEIRHYDLLEPLEGAIASGVEPCAMPGDTWHPSLPLARVMAQWLDGQGLLGERLASTASR